MHIVINQSNNVFGMDAENKIFAQSTETITFDVTFNDPQATLQGLYCALLSDGGKTLALTTIDGNRAVLDTNTIECVEYVAQWAIGTTRHAFLVIGESTKPLAIIDVEVAQNPLEGIMPPTESAPTYPTSAELQAILNDMTEQAKRAEEACKRAESAEASQVAKRAEEKAGEAVETAERAEFIAKGARYAFVFDTKADLDAFVTQQSALTEAERSVRVGDNLYIRATEVPDYWWTGVAPWVSPLETEAVRVTVDAEISATSTNPVANKAIATALDNVSNDIQDVAGSVALLEDTKADALTRTATINNVGNLDPTDMNSMANAENCNQYFQIGSLADWGVVGKAVKLSRLTIFRRAGNTPCAGDNLWMRILRWDGGKWYVAYQASQYQVFGSYTNNGQAIAIGLTHVSGTEFIPTDERVIVCFTNNENAQATSTPFNFGAKVVSSFVAMIASSQTSIPTSPNFTPNLSVKLAMVAEGEIREDLAEVLDGKQDKFSIGEGLTFEDNVLSTTAQEIDVESLEKNATVWDGVRLSCKNYEGKEQVNDVFDWWTSSLGELLGFSFESLVNVKRITLFKRSGSGDDVPNGDAYLNLRIWRYTSTDGWIVQYESSNKVRMNDFAEGQPMVFDMVDIAGNGTGFSADSIIVLAFCDYNRSDKFVRASAKSVQFDTKRRYGTKGIDFSKYGGGVLSSYADYNGTPAVVIDFEAEPYFYELNKKYTLPATQGENINIRAVETSGVWYGVAIGDTHLSDYSVKIGHLQTSGGVNGAYSVQIGAYAHILSNFAISIGYRALAGYGSVVVGADSSADQQAVLVGSESQTGTHSVGVGRFVNVGEGCTGVGFNTYAYRGGSVAIGREADADIESVAIGRNGYAINGGVSLGDNAQALADGSVAIGCKCQNNTSNSVKIQARNATDGATFSVKTIAGKSLDDSFIEFIHTDTLSGEVTGRRISASNFFAMLDQFGATDEISESDQGYGYYS